MSYDPSRYSPDQNAAHGLIGGIASGLARKWRTLDRDRRIVQLRSWGLPTIDILAMLAVEGHAAISKRRVQQIVKSGDPRRTIAAAKLELANARQAAMKFSSTTSDFAGRLLTAAESRHLHWLKRRETNHSDQQRSIHWFPSLRESDPSPDGKEGFVSPTPDPIASSRFAHLFRA